MLIVVSKCKWCLVLDPRVSVTVGVNTVAGTHAPPGPALAMPFIEDEWWSAENEGRMVDLSNCLQVI